MACKVYRFVYFANHMFCCSWAPFSRHQENGSPVLLLNQLPVFAISWIQQHDPALSGPGFHPAHSVKTLSFGGNSHHITPL